MTTSIWAGAERFFIGDLDSWETTSTARMSGVPGPSLAPAGDGAQNGPRPGDDLPQCSARPNLATYKSAISVPVDACFHCRDARTCGSQGGFRLDVGAAASTARL